MVRERRRGEGRRGEERGRKRREGEKEKSEEQGRSERKKSIAIHIHLNVTWMQ